MTTTRDGGLESVLSKRDGRALPAPSSITEDHIKISQYERVKRNKRNLPVFSLTSRRPRSIRSARNRAGENRWSASNEFALN